MKMLFRIPALFIMFVFMISGLLIGCNSPATVISPEPTVRIETPQPPPAAIPKPPADLPANRVEVAYFHMPQRCVTCICFEQRADYVVKTYFQNELANGKLTFQINNIGDKVNAAVVKRYNALGSQLFVNMIINNADHIKDIQDIWDWRCNSDKPGFDDKVITVIKQSLEAVK
jgi:hypothetical protein